LIHIGGLLLSFRDGFGAGFLYLLSRLELGSPRGTNPLQQAERNARWLSNHLTKKTGENVSIQALIVLPGWFVEQGKGNFNVKAMNAAYLAGFLRREDEKLEPAQVRRIINALDEKCRTLEF
jgi:hypothetical protein